MARCPAEPCVSCRFCRLSALLARTFRIDGGRESWLAVPPGFDVVPLWYHVVMAMNLRLDDEDSALLKALAEAEQVSLHEAALRATGHARLRHPDRVREATAECSTDGARCWTGSATRD